MDSQAKPSRFLIILCFAIIYIIWGSTYLCIKVAIHTMPPLLMSGSRYFAAGLVVYLIAKAQKAAPPSPVHWRNAFIIGALLLLAGNGGVVLAEEYIPSGVAALFVCSVPIWFTVLGWLFFSKGRPSAITTIGIIIGFLGIVVLFGPAHIFHSGTSINLTGVLIICVGTLCWSVGSLFASKAVMPANHLSGTGMQMLCGGLLLMLAGLAKGEYGQLHIGSISTESFLAFLYLFLFGSMIAFSAYSFLVRVCPPTLVSTYAYINPVIAVFLGMIFLGEAVDRYTIVGSVLIILALVLITTQKPMVREEAPE